MFHHIPAVLKPHTPNRTQKFEGRPYGAELSFFAVDLDAGQGPRLHWHPYPEIWFVLSGEAAFRIGGDSRAALPGDIVIVPPQTAHRFTNNGPQPLSMLCIHANGVVEQTFLEEATRPSE